jgi:hypothetical protein
MADGEEKAMSKNAMKKLQKAEQNAEKKAENITVYREWGSTILGPRFEEYDEEIMVASEGPMAIYCEAEAGFNMKEVAKGAACYKGLKALPPHLVKVIPAAPRPGFNSQTLIHVAGKPWVALLDNGATCSSGPA